MVSFILSISWFDIHLWWDVGGLSHISIFLSHPLSVVLSSFLGGLEHKKKIFLLQGCVTLAEIRDQDMSDAGSCC